VPDEPDLELQVKHLLVERLGVDRDPIAIADDAPLDETFGLDSARIFTTVVALEEHFDIEIPDEELTSEAFSTVATLTELVRSKAT
jgi:acyl carrier protein